MIGLSERLKTVAGAVTPGHRVADVGCDHGHVSSWLIEEGIAPFVIASDLNRGPLERAEAYIKGRGLRDRISLRQGSGLEPFEPDEVDTVIIAGMGGDLISRLLRERPEFLSAGREFILQPQSEWFRVRHVLHAYQYGIVREWMIKEDGKYYVVIRALPGAEAYDSEDAYRYGQYLIRHRDPVLLAFLEEKIAGEEAIAAGLSLKLSGQDNEKKRSVLEKRIRELTESVREMKAITERFGAGR